MARHKHADLIARWIENTDLVVEYRDRPSDPWEVADYPAWHEEYEYRIVEPKVVMWQWLYRTDAGDIFVTADFRAQAPSGEAWRNFTIIGPAEWSRVEVPA